MRKTLIIVLFVIFPLLASTPVMAQQLRVGIQLGSPIPTDNWTNYASAGFGGMGTLSYEIHSKIAFTAALGYYFFGSSDKNYLAKYGDYDFSVIPIVGGLRYSFLNNPGKISPYIGSEFGIYIHHHTFESEYYGYTSSTRFTKLGISPMAGMKYNINRNLDFDFNMKYTIIDGFSSFGINAGVSLGF